MPPESTKTRPTVGRVVLVFCPSLWDGPRPADVVSVHGDTVISANVKLDGHRDQAALEKFRARPEGNTLASIHVFDPLTDEQRTEVVAGFAPADPERDWHPAWAEWMPFQAAVAKGPTAGDVAKQVVTVAKAVHALAAGLPSNTRDTCDRVRAAVAEVIA